MNCVKGWLSVGKTEYMQNKMYNSYSSNTVYFTQIYASKQRMTRCIFLVQLIKTLLILRQCTEHQNAREIEYFF